MDKDIAQLKREVIINMMHYNAQIRTIRNMINVAAGELDMIKAGVDNAFDYLLRELDKEQPNDQV